MFNLLKRTLIEQEKQFYFPNILHLVCLIYSRAASEINGRLPNNFKGMEEIRAKMLEKKTTLETNLIAMVIG